MSSTRLRIGFSSCIFHPDPNRPIFKGKTLLYLEQSIAHWLMNHGAMAILIPTPTEAMPMSEMVAECDGLLLQGGVDVSPEHYQEEAIKPEWQGDRLRDQYEMSLVKEAIRQDRPILGICRGAQLLNVAMGGSLYQDIETQHDQATKHRCPTVYDQLSHEIRFDSSSVLGKIYPNQDGQAVVNSVHHQAIRRLGHRLVPDAFAVPDGIIEAVRYDSPDRFLYGVQWHPEFHDQRNTSFLPSAPLMEYFLQEVAKRRKQRA